MAPPFLVGSSSRAWEKALALGLVAYAFGVAVVLLCPRRCDFRAWLSKLHTCWRPPTSTKEEAARERRVRAECESRRVERARLLIIANSVLSLLQGVGMIRAISADSINTGEMLILSVALFGRCTTALLSSRLTPRILDGFFCFNVLVTVGMKVSGGLSSVDTRGMRAIVLFQLLYWSVASLKPWLNALGFLCIAVGETVVVCLAGSPLAAIYGWILYFCGATLIFGLDYILKRSVRMEILAADSENELEAIRTLLDSICDVVLQLDSRLRLKNHSPKLAQLLLIQAPGRTLEGEDLQAHMATEQDRAIFADRLQSSQVASAHATVFHAKMRDSNRSIIDMEFFSVGFRGRDSNRHHILGMREFTDIRPVLPPQRLPPALPAPRVSPVPAQTAHAPAAAAAPPLGPALGQVGGPAGRGGPADLELGGLGLQATSSSLAVVAPLAPSLSPPASLQGPPLQLAPQPVFHQRGEQRIGLGTPAAVGQGDIRSHRSASPSAPRSEPDDLAPSSVGSGERPSPPLVETAPFARELSISLLLCSWALRVPPGACCPKHTALLRLESTVAKMKAKPCDEDFGPITEWQCLRCGIMSEEYQDPRHRRKCVLCKRASDSALWRDDDEAGGGGCKMAM